MPTVTETEELQNIGVELGEIQARAEDGTATEEDIEKADKLMQRESELMAKKETESRVINALGERNTGPVESAGAVVVKGPIAEQEEYPLGTYMQDIAKHEAGNYQARVIEYQKFARHQIEVQAAATGASEAVPSDGGYLVGTDKSNKVIDRSYQNDELAKRADNYEISNGSNSMEILVNDESSRADGSRHGGTRFYWVAEAGDFTASKPKFGKRDLKLKKGGCLFYATDEMMTDSALLGRKATEYVGEEISFARQDAMLNGDGAGKPLGILESSCLVGITKESGQAADTIVWNNIKKMWARFMGTNPLWIANRDTFPQLASLSEAIGTGGVPVWMPAGGASASEYERIMGAPLVYLEQCPTLGDKGDLILCDWSQYILAGKGGVQAAMSIHVEFVADEVVYRWIIRMDGQPAWSSALTPYKGTDTRSPFIAINERT